MFGGTMGKPGVNKVLTLLSVTAGLLMIAAPMFAHHGTGVSFESEKTITLTGTVTEFRFANPHAQLFFDVKDNSGKVVNWGAEIESAYSLIQAGWSKRRSEEALKPGTVVTVTMFPGKSGNPVGLVSKILNTKGETLLTTRD
jgi:hypothetical protein